MRRSWILLLLPALMVGLALTAVWPGDEPEATSKSSKTRKQKKSKRRAAAAPRDRRETTAEKARKLDDTLKRLAKPVRSTEEEEEEPGTSLSAGRRTVRADPADEEEADAELDSEAEEVAPPELESTASAPNADLWPLSKEGIMGAVMERQAEIKECYDAWLEAEPDLGGRMVAAFTIATLEDNDDVARVSTVDLEETDLDHAVFTGCVLNVFQGLNFEAPEDGGQVEVHYPLFFSNNGEDD